MPALPNQRALFDIPSDVVYLNCAYMSPLLKAARAAGEEGVARKSTPWLVRSEDFFTESEVARGLFAVLIGAEADDVALVPAASYGIAVAARNLAVSSGQTIVTLAEQFPSNIYAWRDLAARNNATVVAVPRPSEGTWTDAVLGQIDTKTAIAAVPNCHWINGMLLDLVKIRQACDAVGAALVIDGSQSIGAYPFDVKKVRPDFMVAPTYKWLLGPYAMGFLYVAPKYQDGCPLEENWIARKSSEDFGALIDYQDGYQPGARRYDVGERANFALMPIAIAALRQLLAWGADNISATLGVLTAKMADGLQQAGFDAPPGAGRAPHYFNLPWAGDATALQKKLAQQKIYFSTPANSLRVTPHLYNGDEDIAKFIQALAAAR